VHLWALALAFALVAIFPSGVSASIDETAKITLASLLGGVPALGILMLFGLCLWIRKRKRDLRRHALAHGIELDSDGWPIDPNYVVTHDLELITHERSGGTTPMTLPLRSTDSKDAVPPPPYHRPVLAPPAPSYDSASPLAQHPQLSQQQTLSVPTQAGQEGSSIEGGERTNDLRGIRQSMVGVAI